MSCRSRRCRWSKLSDALERPPSHQIFRRVSAQHQFFTVTTHSTKHITSPISFKMGLVDYSESEGSDDETQPQPTPRDMKSTNAKQSFQKVVDRSNPSKIKISLP